MSKPKIKKSSSSQKSKRKIEQPDLPPPKSKVSAKTIAHFSDEFYVLWVKAIADFGVTAFERNNSTSGDGLIKCWLESYFRTTCCTGDSWDIRDDDASADNDSRDDANRYALEPESYTHVDQCFLNDLRDYEDYDGGKNSQFYTFTKQELVDYLRANGCPFDEELLCEEDD